MKTNMLQYEAFFFQDTILSGKLILVYRALNSKKAVSSIPTQKVSNDACIISFIFSKYIFFNI
jgi:hypothetical protein